MGLDNLNQSGLKVAMVARRVHPIYGPGGLERHVYELTCNLARVGVQLDLFVAAPRKMSTVGIETISFPKGVTAHCVPDKWLPFGEQSGTVILDRITNYPAWSRRVAKLMLEAQSQEVGSHWSVIHVHGLAGLGLAQAAGRGHLRSPLVLTTHGLEEFRSHLWMKHLAYSPFRSGIRKIAAESDAVVATDVSLQPLVETCLQIPAAEQVVLPNAVDPAKCRRLGNQSRGRELLSSLGLGQMSTIFLSVGRVESNKGFDLLAKAFALANRQLPDRWGWVLVGDGPDRRKVEKIVKKADLAKCCAFPGKITDDNLHSLYEVADWFVHPTLYEGSSIVTLEAMAHGLPVIATYAGGLPDKVEEGVTGFLVPPGNLGVLVKVLKNIKSVDGKSFGRAGQKVCESRFSWDVVTPQYLALYERLSADNFNNENPKKDYFVK